MITDSASYLYDLCVYESAVIWNCTMDTVYSQCHGRYHIVIHCKINYHIVTKKKDLGDENGS